MIRRIARIALANSGKIAGFICLTFSMSLLCPSSLLAADTDNRTPAEELADRVALLEEQLDGAKAEIARLEGQVDRCRDSLATAADESRLALEASEAAQSVQERAIRRLRREKRYSWWKPLVVGIGTGYVLNDAID